MGTSGNIPGKNPADATMYFYPAWNAFHNSPDKTEFAFWNPYILCGFPQHAEGQLAFFYPVNWLHFFLPVDYAMNLFIFLHLAILISGLWIFGDYFKLSLLSKIWLIITFAFSSAMISRIYAGHHSMLPAISLLPFITLYIFKIFDNESDKPKERLWNLALSGLCFTLVFLAGHPQSAFNTVIFTGIITVFLMLKNHRGIKPDKAQKHKWKKSAALCLPILTGALIASVQILPSLELAFSSSRSELKTSFASSFSFPPENFAGFIFPGLFGDDSGAPYWGRCYRWEMTAYTGIIPLILSAASIIHFLNPFGKRKNKSLKKNTQKERNQEQINIQYGYIIKLFAAVFLIFALLALGDYNPLYKISQKIIPLFKLFRGSCKFIIFAVFALSVLSTLGFEIFIVKKYSSAAIFVFPAGLIAAGFLFITAFHSSGAVTENWARFTGYFLNMGERYTDTSAFNQSAVQLKQYQCAFNSVVVTILLCAVFIAAVLLKNKATGNFKWIFPAVVLLLTAADLAMFTHSFLSVFKKEKVLPPDRAAEIVNSDMKTNAVQNLRVFAPGIAGNPWLGLSLQTPEGYAGVNLRWQEKFAAKIKNEWLPVLNYTGVRYFIAVNSNSWDMIRNNKEFLSNFSLLSKDGAMFCRNASVTSRIYQAEKLSPAENEDKALEQFVTAANAGKKYAFSENCFTEKTYRASENNPAAGENRIQKDNNKPSFKIVKESPCKIKIEISDLNNDTFLVLADTYEKNWRAEIDGKETKILKTNCSFRGVEISAGSKTLIFKYVPMSFYKGALISIASLFSAIALFIFFRRRYREKEL